MTDQPDPDQPTAFHVFFETLAAGVPHAEAQQALAVVVEEVERLNKKGSVTIKLEVKPAGDASRQVMISAAVTSTPPQPDPAPSVYFVGSRGTVHRDDPYNRPFAFPETDVPAARPVPEDPAPRQIGDGASPEGTTQP